MTSPLSHIIKFTLAATAVLFMASCVKESGVYEPQASQSGEKVTIPLFADMGEMDKPLGSRMGVADEDGITGNPWVFVYSGTDMYAPIVEITRAEVDPVDGNSYVKLSKHDGACQVFILANAPSKVTFGNLSATWFPNLNQSHLDTYYGPNSTNNVMYRQLFEMSKMFRTPSLGTVVTGGATPVVNDISSVPYTGNGELIPMAGLFTLADGIHENTTLGTPGSELQLQRLVAKIVINNETNDFKLEGATVINTSNRSNFLRMPANTNYQETINYIGTPDIVKDISPATDGTGNVKQTTADNPIYVYESKAGTMSVIIKAQYTGLDNVTREYYYKMAPLDQNGAFLPVERNHIYTFTITKVLRPGFSTFEEACDSRQVTSNDLIVSLAVTEHNAHDIVENSKYYMAVTNSVFHAYTNKALTATEVTYLYTNYFYELASEVTGGYVSVLSGSGLTITSPAAVDGVHKITSNKTSIKVSMTSAFTTGKLYIRVGDLEKTITIERKTPLFYQAGGTMVFTQCVSASSNQTWLQFSHDGTNTVGQSIYYPASETVPTTGFTMHVAPSGGTIRTGLVYVNPVDNTEGRRRLYIEQNLISSK